MPLTATGPEFFVATMTTFLSDYYDALEENLTHVNSLKLKRYLGGNLIYFCAAILVDADRLNSDEAFKPEQLGYITRIFGDTSDSRFRLWDIQNCKEVADL